MSAVANAIEEQTRVLAEINISLKLLVQHNVPADAYVPSDEVFQVDDDSLPDLVPVPADPTPIPPRRKSKSKSKSGKSKSGKSKAALVDDTPPVVVPPGGSDDLVDLSPEDMEDIAF